MKKILSFFALAAIMISFAACSGSEPEQTEFKVIGLPDAFVKCITDDSYFEQNGFIYFVFHTNPDFQLIEHVVEPDYEGTCLSIGLAPKDRNKLVGTFTVNDNAGGWYDIAENRLWTGYKDVRRGTVTVTQNADKSYNFDLDIEIEKLGEYQGTITGIRM